MFLRVLFRYVNVSGLNPASVYVFLPVFLLVVALVLELVETADVAVVSPYEVATSG